MDGHQTYGFDDNGARVPVSQPNVLEDRLEVFLLEMGVETSAMAEWMHGLMEVLESERRASIGSNIRYILNLFGDTWEVIAVKRALGLSDRTLRADARACGRSHQGLKKIVRRIKKKLPPRLLVE